MSSVHKLPGKKNWICFYTDRDGRRRAKSTMTPDKREATRVCGEVQRLEDLARNRKLTFDKAHSIIASTVASIMDSLGTPLPQVSIRQNAAEWIQAREVETARNTFLRYDGIMKAFLDHLGAKADRDLATLGSSDISAYRAKLVGHVSNSTVNNHLKVLRVWLEKAVKAGIFDRNPARLVDYVDASDKAQRRGFTMAELRKILEIASQDWKTAVLVGLYTGLRLNDAVNLTHANLSADQGELTVRTQKTGRVQILPVAKPLRRHIETLPAGDDPKTPLCPTLAGRPVAALSAEFFEVMASAGLAKSRKEHTATTKRGRSGKRERSELSFHSLRHSATSLLKNAGVSDAVARDIIGHESAAVSANYTHIEPETKRRALDALPDLLATQPNKPTP